MAKLMFLLDGNVIKEYALDKERMTIGRRASNDVHIDNLAISGVHAEIVSDTGEAAYIQDLNSTNGTLVNKEPIKKQMLKHGDTIGLGKYQLKYLEETLVSRSSTDGFADTVLVEPQSPAEDAEPASVESISPLEQNQNAPQVVSEPIEEQGQSVVEAEASSSEVEIEPSAEVLDETPSPEPKVQSPRLQILNGENEGSTLLLDKSMVKVGQPGEQVAVVTKRQDGYFITHVAGERYPMVNGKQLGAHAYALNNHDEIEVLGIKMEFCLD